MIGRNEHDFMNITYNSTKEKAHPTPPNPYNQPSQPYPTNLAPAQPSPTQVSYSPEQNMERVKAKKP